MLGNAVREDFPQLTDPFRGELLAHCYRMVGSIHDAEDLVQETYLKAWRAYEGFEGRSSLRTWLYRIATTTCLRALENRSRRPLPIGLGGSPADPEAGLRRDSGTGWLEPFPDTTTTDAMAAGTMTTDRSDDPAAIVTSRESIRLAFVAALQHLPPRQRAVLVLRDVLQWRAAEVAANLDMSIIAVNSLLQRARGTLKQLAPDEDTLSVPGSADERAVVDSYVRAFEAKDLNRLVALFTEAATWEMPPFLGWYTGPRDITRHLELRCLSLPGPVHLVRRSANGQPAVATYMSGSLANLQVLTVAGGAISRVVTYADASLYTAFALPETLS